MAIHYPNGGLFTTKNSASKKKPRANNTIYGKRGMSLEDEINESNKYYLFSWDRGHSQKADTDPRSLMFIIPNVAPQ